ncbi:hypothetical protein SAMN05216382_0053 [Sphingomonas palmae]|uniref:Aspartyl protease n=1 Tax=Sphingomonas palmae TaxID=1855283 RepID=A0A1H7FHM8_9SPHN|nr:hypothetical protein [Sphingomonas palmae]SEK25478.1 hypothetical protein SAMN05216382_0053 [Sphingomonas palmae]
MIRPVAVIAAGILTATGAQAQEAPRSIVPIREVDIRPVGTPRYVIEFVVNGAPMMAGLDTGSTGLRLLPRAAARARVAPGGEAETYSYGSGVELDGRRVDADVAIGGARGRVAIQAIDRVTCVARQPDCPAARVSPDAYGLMGSGQPGQGFPAIIGIRLMSGRVDNPFRALGVRRWIVHLPQRGGGAGALVLNPEARDLAGFVPLQPGAANPRGTVAGCVSLAIPGAERLCGPTLLDTGAPGLTVLDRSAPPRWQEGARARIDFAPTRGSPPPALGFVAGDKAHGAHATFKPGGSDRVTIHAGTLPFYAYDVLFDADSNTIAVRPNLEAGPAVVPLNQ